MTIPGFHRGRPSPTTRQHLCLLPEKWLPGAENRKSKSGLLWSPLMFNLECTNKRKKLKNDGTKNLLRGNIERFGIPFYGIFKRNLYPTGFRVRPAASRRWLSMKTVLHFAGRFGGFVWQFCGSGWANVLSRSSWISSLLFFWLRTKTEIWTKKNFFFFSHAEWKTLQLLFAPHFSLPWSAGWRGLCSTCSTPSFVPDCFLLQFSLFPCCLRRRFKQSPADFLERPTKRSGPRQGHQLPGYFVQGRVPT